MVIRGVSLMVGGYPNEMQTISWIHEGYVMSTSNYFFAYLVAIVLLFLIGQRTQRAHFLLEMEQSSSYQRVDSIEQQDGPPQIPTST